MYIFGLEGSGFFLSIMFTLLMSGAVVFFLISKIRQSDARIENQAAILAHSLETLRGGASPEAIRAAEQIVQTQQDNLSDSESDGESSSEDDDDESSVEDVMEAESATESMAASMLPNGGLLSGGGILPGAVIMSVGSIMPEPDQGEEVKTIKLEDVEDLEKLGLDETVDWRHEFKKDSSYLNTLKVPQLRNIASKLVDSDVKKLKKSELVHLIKVNHEAPEAEYNVVN